MRLLCRRLQVNGRKLPKIKSLASRIVCFGSGAAARPHWSGWLLSALLGRPVPAFHASRLRHIGSHPVGSAERLKPVQDGAVQASASPSAATPPSVGQKCQGTCGRSDWRIFEPLGGEFDLPIEWVLWEQPVERACYRLQRAAEYHSPGLLSDKRRPCHQSRVRCHHSLQNGLLIS